MVCVHVKKLYSLCEREGLKLSGADLVQIVCKECNVTETCPSLLMEDYEHKNPEESSQKPAAPAGEANDFRESN